MEGILALDQGQVTGWAYCVPGCDPVWGESRIWTKKKGVELDHGLIAADFHSFLIKLINDFAPAQMIYETVYIGGGRIPLNPGSILRLAGLAWYIDFVARMKGISCWKQSTLAAVKALTGRAAYDTTEDKKAATIEACLARGWKAGQHAADALALLMFAEAKLYPQAARTRRKAFRTPTGPLFQVSP